MVTGYANALHYYGIRTLSAFCICNLISDKCHYSCSLLAPTVTRQLVETCICIIRRFLRSKEALSADRIRRLSVPRWHSVECSPNWVWRFFTKVVKQAAVSWQSAQWRPYFTWGHKWTSVRTSLIPWQIWVKFGIGGVHVMWSSCVFGESETVLYLWT